MKTLKLLDCTLRDGGYVNDWEFGHNHLINILERLVSSNVEVIEVCFLDDRRSYNPEKSILPNTEAVNRIYAGIDSGNSMLVGMIDYGTCKIENIQPCGECILDGIRVIFKKEMKEEALAFCAQIKSLGYHVFIQATSITGYRDEELIALIAEVNRIKPYAFSLVDTYGLLHKSQLIHYFDMVDYHLDSEIGVGYHSHNNFQLSYANSIELLERPINRMLLVDASLYGMGKSAGNTPIELLAMYMNENCNKNYDISQMMEGIEISILDIFKKAPWGYSFKFYIAASNDCHPNYVDYLMDKKKLSVKSINEILSSIKPNRKLTYDREYIEELYIKYQKQIRSVTANIEYLGKIMNQQKILLLAPGTSIKEEKGKIKEYISSIKPIVISVNFIPLQYEVEYVFISNAKRYVQLSKQLSQEENEIKTIATSNVTKSNGKFDYTFCYSDLLDEEALTVDNPMIMLIKLLTGMQVKEIVLAGFDGYTKVAQANYVNPNKNHTMDSKTAMKINQDVIASMKRLKTCCPIRYLTESIYDTN